MLSVGDTADKNVDFPCHPPVSYMVPPKNAAQAVHAVQGYSQYYCCLTKYIITHTRHDGNMRFRCSFSRQQAAVALIVGRRFASAFIAAPRGGLLSSSTAALPIGATPCGR